MLIHFVDVAQLFSRRTAGLAVTGSNPGSPIGETGFGEGSSGGLPGGLRSQGGSRANEVDRTVPEVYQCGAVSEHFCTACGSVQFGTVRATLSSRCLRTPLPLQLMTGIKKAGIVRARTVS